MLVLDAPGAPDRVPLLQAFGQQASTALSSAENHGLMRRKESELASIIQSVPNPIILVDHDARIVSINPSAESLFGISTMFCAGAPVAGQLGSEEIEGALTSPGDVSIEVSLGVPPRAFKLRATDVQVPGTPSGRVLIMDDVTRDREMTQTQHDFVAMIGHELRTPLTVIKGFTRMLLKRSGNAPLDDRLEALSIIDAKTDRLERLIEDLLYVSKIETREASLKLEPVNIRGLCQDVAEEVLGEHAEREVEVDVAEDLYWPCDATKTDLVLRHLVENALKYSEGPDPVTIRVTQEDDLRFDVVDRGVGIVSTDIPHLFERFRQLDGSSTREQGGTGVGLYLCAQLVRLMEGRIWVDSSWGKGSTFSFTLPKRAAGAAVVSIQGKRLAQA